jgi:hypothetical protein
MSVELKKKKILSPSIPAPAHFHRYIGMRLLVLKQKMGHHFKIMPAALAPHPVKTFLIRHLRKVWG